MAGTGDNQTPQFWEDFYSSIYGPATTPAMSPQVALAYGQTNTPQISDMVRAKGPTMQNVPTRLAQNVGTPQGGTTTAPQVMTLGVGLGPNVNALGYRTTVPNAPVTAASPAVAAINSSAPPKATVRAPSAMPAAGINPNATVPSWIRGMSAPADKSVSVVQGLRDRGYSPSAAYDVANLQSAQRARDGASNPSHQSSGWFNEVTGR